MMGKTRVALYAIICAINVGVTRLHGMEDQHQAIEPVEPLYNFPDGEYDLPEDQVLEYAKQMSELYQSLNQPRESNAVRTGEKLLASPEKNRRKRSQGRQECSSARKINKWKVVCDECNRVFKFHCALYDHISSFHPEAKPFPCDSCHKKFTKYEDLRQHRFKCARQNRIECNKCRMTFTSEASYERHLFCRHGVDRSTAR